MVRTALAVVLVAFLASTVQGYELSEVKNLGSFYLSDQAKERLQEKGFVILPSGKEDIYQIYIEAKKRGEPVVVTSDLLLHTAHLLFDYSLRVVERRELLEELGRLTEGMLEESEEQLRVLKDEEMRRAALRNCSFFGVGAGLLGIQARPPEEVRVIAEEEIGLIEAHKGISPSPLFGYLEDYSQYIPRGHYTRNEEFRKFFKAMTWYGRMGFYLHPGRLMYPGGVDTEEEGRRLTRAALLIVSILTSSPELMSSWERIYQPTAFFVGKTDDLDLYDYQRLALDVYGKGPFLAELGRDQALQSFIEKASKLREPRICSTPVTDVDLKRAGSPSPIQGFRFFGQRFIPDSYTMQNLVYDKVVNYTGKGKPFTMENSARGPQRCFPRGLDVMASLGSQLAREIVYREGDGDYENYGDQLKKLREEFSSLSEEVWRSNLYFIWLCSLRSLLTREDRGYPALMKTEAWKRKELNTALGSWAELRHDTILYAKQSYTIGITSVPPPPSFARGWVEPYPELYRKMGDLISEMARRLETLNRLPGEVSQKLTRFREVLSSLEGISRKELRGEGLSEDEYRLVWEIGEAMKALSRFSPDLMAEISTGTDEKMAIVADVHTDPNTGRVLEEAVGNPAFIYLICSVEGETVLTKGGVFTYYEFKHPTEDRLTDERWQELVERREIPEIPTWVQMLYPQDSKN